MHQPMTANFESAPRQEYLNWYKAVDYTQRTVCKLHDQRVSCNNSQRSLRTAHSSAFVVFGPERSSPSSRRLQKIMDDLRDLETKLARHEFDTIEEDLRNIRKESDIIRDNLENLSSGIIEEETKVLYPDSITLPHLIIYGTDSRYFREKGAQCYGFFPGPVSMEEYARIHGNDERIRIDSLRNATRIYYNVVKRFCEGKNKEKRPIKQSIDKAEESMPPKYSRERRS